MLSVPTQVRRALAFQQHYIYYLQAYFEANIPQSNAYFDARNDINDTVILSIEPTYF